MTAILGSVLCFSLLFAKPKDVSVTIKNPIQIRTLDSIANSVIKTGKNITLPINPLKVIDTTSGTAALPAAPMK
jgi:hypothetical protein